MQTRVHQDSERFGNRPDFPMRRGGYGTGRGGFRNEDRFANESRPITTRGGMRQVGVRRFEDRAAAANHPGS